MAEKVTTMAIKVDLQCERCYQKIRKVLCSFPEIRNQVYNEKQNVVLISVVSCCPERILKKICSKGGKSVEKVEIVTGDNKKKDEPEKKPGKEGEPKKKPEGEKTAPASKEPEKKNDGGGDKSKEPAEKKALPAEKKVQFAPRETMPVPVAAGYPSIFPPVYPVQGYYDPYQQHQMYAGGHMPCPCSHCHGMPVPYMARDANRGIYYGNQYDYFSEENPSSCAVM